MRERHKHDNTRAAATPSSNDPLGQALTTVLQGALAHGPWYDDCYKVWWGMGQLINLTKAKMIIVKNQHYAEEFSARISAPTPIQPTPAATTDSATWPTPITTTDSTTDPPPPTQSRGRHTKCLQPPKHTSNQAGERANHQQNHLRRQGQATRIGKPSNRLECNPKNPSRAPCKRKM